MIERQSDKNLKTLYEYEMIDFPESTLGVCRVYGKKDSVIYYDAQCREKLAEEDIYCGTDDNKWSFQRFGFHVFMVEDKYGKRIVEYGYFL